jgi:predicted RecB family nuclease
VQRVEGRLVLSPTDLTKHLACAHATTLDLAVVAGAVVAPHVADDALTLIFELGLEHERAYLASLRAEGRSITEIPTAFDADGRRRAEQQTLDAMRSGADVVYQGTFFDGSWGGQADFLLRVDRPSRLGPWSYEIADTKLARRLKVPALLQMAVYAERLEHLQGVAPEGLYVVTGDGENRPWRLVDVAAYARHVRGRLRSFTETRPVTEPVPVTHCGQCRWLDRCAAQWRREDDLSLVAFMRGDHRAALRAHGITTLAGLAACAPDDLPRGIGRASRERLVQQAAEQLRERTSGKPSYLLLPPVPGTGLLRLPPPDQGDLYLDFEGDPYAEGGEGREYLAGVGDRGDGFIALWAHDRDAERQLTADLVDLLLARWRAYPDMHVYHYAAYEVSALKRLTARHGVREAELDQLLRGERFVDLYAVVRQGLRISKPSYSIKKLEAFYWHAERNKDEDVADAMASVLAYERWLVEREGDTLAQIEAYNRDDVRSTHALQTWLEGRRDELEDERGAPARPQEQKPEPDRPRTEAELTELELVERLAGHPLLADLVQWHRREARPAWWDYYRLGDLDEDELVDDGTALGPLSAPELVGTDKRSRLWRYTFAPQDTRVRVGKTVHDVDDHEAGGTVVELDALGGTVVVKRQAEPKSPRAFGPPGPIDDKVLRESVAAAAEDRLAGRPGLAGALLHRRAPAGTAVRPGETPADAVLRVGTSLDGTVLAVQGPPGSGKTTVGAKLIRALLDAGKTVGVTATSHAVIGHLLGAVGRPALHKCDEDQHSGNPAIVRAATNPEVAAALADGSARLVGGTSWMWAREEMASAVDVLVVDEAGQYSLANAVAVARGARSMVLLGDPQQLAQPSRAEHPGGAGASVLEHLLDGHDTVPPDRGIFLDRSWRMHPAITEFVSDLAYEGRLTSGPGRERQEVRGAGSLSGNGLRVVEVAHAGNAAKSPEEARAVADLWTSLQGAAFVDSDGATRRLGPDDVLVVAPYNNQVAEILALLPAGARAGTVDRFQGQEAPVVLYSMTSSSAADAPRGVDFLYDLHRLNVAVSRAQALAVVVLSPALLDAAVRSPEQLRRVNALCRLVEHATGSGKPPRDSAPAD